MSNANQPQAARGMLCPVCRVNLEMTERQGVEVDYCPSCRGVWLDRGELDKILERSVSGPASGVPGAGYPVPPAAPSGYYGGGYGHHDEHHGGHHGGHHGRRSFLHDIFG